ncbi:hypothetical protein, conserved [Plasmodium gonderi]|uniref:Uncharacterized protein n=1 Tax=Plasmodium gonderi TaxID=77519 RepID=A0A1Y1JKU0_PLAGO|nr:hypothetical protein, conserved [Plasmodium gonderi]GAW81033.1 hypothetical protein, conserved [Plasmodium gonderi]
MNNNFRSPESNDPIKKLQNLLNNCLYSVIDVLNKLSYEGEPKELEIVPEEESEYAYFVNLLKERACEIQGETNEGIIKGVVAGEEAREVEEVEEVNNVDEVEKVDEVREEAKTEQKAEPNEHPNGDGKSHVNDRETNESEDQSSEETIDESYDESNGISNDQSNDDMVDRKKSDDEQPQHSAQEGLEEKKYFVKPNLEKSLEQEILDRVERMNLILKMIDSCIDELPDSFMIEEEKCKEMKVLQKKKDDAKEELKELYNEYDSIYNYVTDSLRNFIVDMD